MARCKKQPGSRRKMDRRLSALWDGLPRLSECTFCRKKLNFPSFLLRKEKMLWVIPLGWMCCAHPGMWHWKEEAWGDISHHPNYFVGPSKFLSPPRRFVSAPFCNGLVQDQSVSSPKFTIISLHPSWRGVFKEPPHPRASRLPALPSQTDGVGGDREGGRV